MTPDALRSRARAIMGSMPLASSDDEECDADDYENFVEKLTAEFLAIRNETIEEAAKECEAVKQWLGTEDMPAVAGGYAHGAMASCLRRIRALSTAGRTKP